MITNERQYKITRSEAEKFRKALQDFRPLNLIKDGIDPMIAEAQKRAMESQLTTLLETLDRYESLQAGEVETLESDTISSIGRQLIEARIARAFTQKELADRLGMKPQQIQRYETEEYMSANLPRLVEVADALGIETYVRFNLHTDTPAKSSVSTSERSFPKLPVRVMKKRGWLSDMHVRGDDTITSDVDLAALFVQRHTSQFPIRSLHKQTVRLNGQYDEGALLAWKARVLQVASQSNPHSDGMGASEPTFLKDLVNLSRFDDGPLRAIHLLGEVGVTVVVERHLDKTHLDGAAMLLDKRHPVIGMTLRHDRLDNFWFVLFHELGHVIRHRSTGLADGFFDDEVASLDLALEQEADDFARNALIPDEVWSSSFVRYSSDVEKIKAFADRLGIHPAIVAGRIRRERGSYTILTQLLGRKTLRAMLDQGAGIPGGYNED